MQYDFERYGIEVGQRYKAADGSGGIVQVIDTESYKKQGDVVVRNYRGEEYRIDCFKLAVVRYYLDSNP